MSSPMKPWRSVNKSKLKREIGMLRANGLTCLTAAIDCATDMFNSLCKENAFLRIIANFKSYLRSIIIWELRKQKLYDCPSQLQSQSSAGDLGDITEELIKSGQNVRSLM